MTINIRGGWIPTIIGELNFSLINPHDYRLDRIKSKIHIYPSEENEKSIDNNINFISMKIDPNDFIYKSKEEYYKEVRIVNFIENINTEIINGSFYIFDPEIDDIINPEELFCLIYNNLEKVNIQIKKFLIFKTSYTIDKKGFVFFNTPINKKNKTIITKFEKQIFIFLKYIFHSNAHHHYSQENISPYIYAKNDKEFYNKIYTHMKKNLTTIRKLSKNQPDKLKNSEGMAEYLKSYLLILKNLNTDLNIEQEISFLQQFINSIHILTSVKQPKFPTLYNFVQDIQLFSFILFPITAPLFIIVLNHKIHNLTIIDKILNFLKMQNNFINYSITTAFIIFFIFFIILIAIYLFVNLCRSITGYTDYNTVLVRDKIIPYIKKRKYKKLFIHKIYKYEIICDE